MEIYIVQHGDSVESIADRYGISVERLISDNGISNPKILVVGQALVILIPKETYIVKPGDSLEAIASANGISIMQLLRNNPFLYNREYIYENESLVISFNTKGKIQTHAFTDAPLSQDTLYRALPYLTYISVYNYRVSYETSSILNMYDDTNIVELAKRYSTIPLLMISALSLTGSINLEHLYALLLNNQLQDKLIDEAFEILRLSEYKGVNLAISYITDYNQGLYFSIIEKISKILRNTGYIFMVTISPNFSAEVNIDYSKISLYVDRIIFVENIWPKQAQEPAPVSNVSLIRPFIENVTRTISPSMISIGKPLIGYDWSIPFTPGSLAHILSLSSIISLAYEENAEIQLDEESQTPYFTYTRPSDRFNLHNIVWFIDARSIKALNDLILEYSLIGTGLWNLRNYYQKLFSIITATFDITKLPLK
ncbi:MAG: LysM peptidoglycan-binding domain-containing protein [Bacillota bacterium]|nr:LysM peptidoglycan-binding domain-containing protein [Bacillota bacterium]